MNSLNKGTSFNTWIDFVTVTSSLSQPANSEQHTSPFIATAVAISTVLEVTRHTIDPGQLRCISLSPAYIETRYATWKLMSRICCHMEHTLCLSCITENCSHLLSMWFSPFSYFLYFLFYVVLNVVLGIDGAMNHPDCCYWLTDGI